VSDDLGDETQAIPVVPEPEPTAPVPAAAPAWVLAERYRVLDRIGAGGMADVFRAHDEQLDRDVAVKVFRTPVDEPGNATAVERREIELRALAQLSHPNLIALYDANVAGARPAFLVTELVIGPNLATRLNDGPLPEDLARTVGAQIADALAYVHARGMVHRDVKPANILLGTDGPTPETATIRARLSDFGIVRLVDSARMTAAEFTLGTAFYLAPEQARGADVTAAADVYALGLVLIEMLSGQRSFDGPMHEAMAARLTRSPEIPAGLSEPWPGLLAAMTRPDPATRPSAAEVAEALRSSMPPAFTPADRPAVAAAAFAATPFGSPPPTGADPVAASAAYPVADPDLEPQRHRGLAMAIAALAFVAVIVTAAILILRPSSPSSAPTGGGTAAPTTGSSAPTSASTTKHRHPVAPATGGSSGPKSASSSSQSHASSAPASTASSRTHTKASSSAPRHSPPPTKRTSTAPTSTAPTTPISSAPPATSASSSAAADPPASGTAAPASGVALASPTS
jgi:serine/threonine protein kinase